MMKQLLLAGAAGLATVSLAQAADVPMEAAEAVEYVKVCTEFGAGFFYIPGTDTCLKLSGHVRADYKFQDKDSDVYTTDTTNFAHNARINFDARTATEFGTLRSFVELNATSSKATVGKAYIQLGGLTAGYAASMFNFYDTNYANTIFADYYTSAKTLNLIAYTATFGGGFYATLSIEDSIARRGTAPDDDNVRFDGITAAGYGDVNGNGVRPAVDAGKWRAEREGSDIPDIVTAIGVSQSWGKAQIMAAVHNIDARADFLDVGVGGADVRVDGEEWGYAVGAGVGVNLPIAAGGHFAIEAVYADGALKYLGDTIGDEFTNHRISYDDNNTTGVADDVSSVDTGSGYSITGEFQVSLSPSLVATAFGSYANVDNAGKDIIDAGGVRLMDTTSYILGANLVYTVTKGLTLGAEVSYVNTEFNYVERTFINSPGTANPRVFSSEESEDLNFGIRLERKW